MDYYEEIAAQAKALMDAGDFDAAFALLDVELKMPYIPKQQEEVLVAYYNRCRIERNAQKPIRRASLDQLEDLLNGRAVSGSGIVERRQCTDAHGSAAGCLMQGKTALFGARLSG